MATYKETVQEIPAGESEYGPEDQLRDHLERFLTAEDIEYLCSKLRVSELRQMAADIMIAGIEHVRGNSSQLEFAILINSWLATAEETVAAGRNLNRVVARRRGPMSGQEQEAS